MISRLGDALSRFAARAVPDPFALALLLTVLVAVVALLSTPPLEVAEAWMSGFSAPPLLAFALQMCLVLVTGHALATSPPVQTAVLHLARIPQNAYVATALVSLVACLAAVVHWGLGAIVGAFLAREMGRHARRENIALHYPLLGAAAYGGMAVWHGGLSGSAPLKVAEEGHFAAAVAGVIPVESTLFGSLNLIVTGGLVVGLPLVFMALLPAKTSEWKAPEALEEVPLRKPTGGMDRWSGYGVGAIGLAVVTWAWLAGGASFDLNLVNLLFLFVGLLFQGSLREYGAAVADGARGAGAIVLQFPFYFGILGMMKAAGMVTALSQAMVSGASATTFPLASFVSAGVTNLFVPSGGGQWAVQGEVLLSAGQRLGVAPEVVVMAFSYGDAWTNMLQPFWALPLLGIMGLKASDIVGYTAVAFLFIGVYVGLALLVLPGWGI